MSSMGRTSAYWMDGSGGGGSSHMKYRCPLHGPHLAMSHLHGPESVISVSLDSNFLISEIRELNPR